MKFLMAALLLTVLTAAGCSTTEYSENCFANATASSGQEGSGRSSDGSGDGTGSGKSEASGGSGCARTPVDSN